jgi:hypothetical protein
MTATKTKAKTTPKSSGTVAASLAACLDQLSVVLGYRPQVSLVVQMRCPNAMISGHCQRIMAGTEKGACQMTTSLEAAQAAFELGFPVLPDFMVRRVDLREFLPSLN